MAVAMCAQDQQAPAAAPPTTTAPAAEPASPAAAVDPATALRARAQEFFDLQVAKKYRQAEGMVAEDTKDFYYNGNKINIKKFVIEKVELLDNNTRGKVTMKSTSTLIVPVAGPVDLDSESTSSWKFENGQWMYHVDDVIETPFGPMKRQPEGGTGASPLSVLDKQKKPDVAEIRSLVKLDRNAVVLTAGKPTQDVTVLSDLPGEVDLSLSADQYAGFKVEIQKTRLAKGEKSTVQVTSTGNGKTGGIVRVLVSPLGTELDIQVTKQ